MTTVEFIAFDLEVDSPCVLALPNGLMPVTAHCFSIALDAGSAFMNGSGRIRYIQNEIANQVYEDTIVVLKWVAEGNGSWLVVDSLLNKPMNYIAFPLDASGIYILVGAPKRNYDILVGVIFPLLGGCVSIVAIKKSPWMLRRREISF